MTQRPDFIEFLQGTASDHQFAACERFLEGDRNPEVNDSSVPRDQLLNALKSKPPFDPNDPEINSLVLQIDQLIPDSAVTKEELSRILLPPDSNESIGKIGKFPVLEFMASGGMGLVFKAVDPNLDKFVCIKLLNPKHEFHQEHRRRFQKEAQSVSKLTNAKIVTILDVGVHKNLPYFVMPFLEGETLASHIKKNQEISSSFAESVILQIAQGLKYAHQHGVLHRDIKPENIWLTEFHDVILLDFGLAQSTETSSNPVTQTGTIIGTPSYMSPEQIRGEAVDGRSDLFSLGTIWLEVLTGKSPFKKSNVFQSLLAVTTESIDVDRLLAHTPASQNHIQIIKSLISKDPSQRPTDAQHLIELLKHPKTAALHSNFKPVFNRQLKTLGIAMFFFTCIALFFGLLHITDKGTIVVTALDPEVEVVIKKEKVKVTDPVSGESYQIRIGNTPLPSGVYSLEVENPNSPLQFSSNLIVIKRGEKSLVKVELKPSENNSRKAVVNTTKKESRPDLGTWADPTYSAKKRRMSYQELLPIKVLQRRSTKTVHVEKWTEKNTTTLDDQDQSFAHLEPNKERTQNCLGSMWATSQTGGVGIYGQDQKLECFLPFEKEASRLIWSKFHPNLLGLTTIKYVPSKKTYIRLLEIWCISNGRADRIFQTEISSYQYYWDQLDRIIYAKDKSLHITELTTNTTWKIPDTSKISSYFTGGLSPSGRFFALFDNTDQQADIHIWDLKQGKFFKRITGFEFFQWDKDPRTDFIALSNPLSKENQLKIIDIKNGQTIFEDTFKSAIEKSGRQVYYSPDLRLCVIQTNLYSLQVINTATSQKSSLVSDSIKEELGKELRRREANSYGAESNRVYSKLKGGWDENGFTGYFGQKRKLTWTRIEDRLEANSVAPSQPEERASFLDFDLSRSAVYISDLQTPGWPSVVYGNSKFIPGGYHNISNFLLPQSQFSIVKSNGKYLLAETPEEIYKKLTAVDPALPKHDLKIEELCRTEKAAVLIVSSEDHRRRRESSLFIVKLSDRKFHHFKVSNSKPLKTKWSPDQRFLFVEGEHFIRQQWNQQTYVRPGTLVVDMKTWRAEPISNTYFYADRENHIYQTHQRKNSKGKFRTYDKVKMHRSRIGNKSQPILSEGEIVDLGSHQVVNIKRAEGRQILMMSDSKQNDVYKELLNGKLLDLDLPKNEFLRSYSYDRKFYTFKNQIYETSTEKRVPNQVPLKHDVNWHPTENAFVHLNDREEILFFNLENQTTVKVNGRFHWPLFPVENGWMVKDRGREIFLEYSTSGTPLGRTIFEVNQKTKQLHFGRISPNGKQIQGEVKRNLVIVKSKKPDHNPR